MFRNNFVSFRAMLLTGAVMSVAPMHGAMAADMPSETATAESATAQPAGDIIIVTAQKREERIQDVPIAISAFSAAQLDSKKIEGGSELLRSVPNLNFSKSFSSMYNVAIRGIGTKALNSTSDPGVAIAFNNTPLIRNRMFEQEFYDLARVEVLRGPQGTLYGRNSTAGLINIIPAVASPEEFEGMIKGETGSYSTRRLSGMLNIPLGDTLAIRGAGAMTKRNGFDYNTYTNKRVNGRDLWSTRISAAWEPSSNFKANLIWEHFEEDDDRARTGKALCTRDPGPEKVGDTLVPDNLRARLNQGCLPGSLYDDAAYGVPTGMIHAGILFGQSISLGNKLVPGLGMVDVPILKSSDPFEGVTQSRDPRRIATATDPRFRAKNDVFQLNMELNLGENLTVVSQTAYSRDKWYSSQDYNRFLSNPIFNDSLGLISGGNTPYLDEGPTPGGVYNDYQLGSSDRLLSVDLNRTNSKQWMQELRLQSSFDGPVNFMVGANYLNFKTRDDYYAFSNLFTSIAEYGMGMYGFSWDYRVKNDCVLNDPREGCLYVDRNSFDNIDDQGHNYFLSRTYATTKSIGLFGEAYWNVSDDVKITLGGRYTSDRKKASQIPSQLLMSDGRVSGGSVNSGYPRGADIKQGWDKFSGRAVIDWKPNVPFSDDTLLYFSASHGYKGGGANPPRVDFNPKIVQYLPLADRFGPEGMFALELGTKNTFDDGKFTLNASAFFYDYKGYQVSQVTDRITFTENFPAQVWGLELESLWRPSRAFQVDGNLGFLQTRIKNGARSIDVMNRTQGNQDWVVLRPWLQVPNNCIAPRDKVEKALNSDAVTWGFGEIMLAAFCPGSDGGVGHFRNDGTSYFDWTPITGVTYDPFLEAPNAGRGFYADLKGNELPNAPNLTFNIGAQYTFFIDDNDWNMTFRGDYYRQSKSYARVYNTEIDKLNSWGNFNLSVSLKRPKSELEFQLYVKNVFDKQPITDVFISADDIGMPANTFYLDPRIIGFNVSKKF